MKKNTWHSSRRLTKRTNYTMQAKHATDRKTTPIFLFCFRIYSFRKTSYFAFCLLFFLLLCPHCFFCLLFCFHLLFFFLTIIFWNQKKSNRNPQHNKNTRHNNNKKKQKKKNKRIKEQTKTNTKRKRKKI